MPRHAASCWSRSRRSRATTPPSATNAIAVLSDPDASPPLRERARTPDQGRARLGTGHRRRRARRAGRPGPRARGVRGSSRSSCCAISIRCRRSPNLVDAARAAFNSKSRRGPRRGAAAVREGRSGARRRRPRDHARRQEAREAAPRRGGARVGRGREREQRCGRERARRHAQGRGSPTSVPPPRRPPASSAARIRTGWSRWPRARTTACGSARPRGSRSAPYARWERQRRGRRHRAAVAREGPPAPRRREDLRAPREAEAVARDPVPRAARRGSPRIPRCIPIGSRAVQRRARRKLRRACGACARRPTIRSVEVRRIVMCCVADGPDPAKNGAAIAAKLVKRSRQRDPRRRGARARADRRQGQALVGVGEALVQLLDDPDREVRVIAIRAIGALGATPRSPHRSRWPSCSSAATRARSSRCCAPPSRSAPPSSSGSRSPTARRWCASTRSMPRSAPGLRAAATLSAALADADPQVRKAALERLAAQKDKLEPAVLDRALSLAVRDPEPGAQPARADHDRACRAQGGGRRAAPPVARVARRARARPGRGGGDRARRSRRDAQRPAARAAARRSLARRPRRDAAGARPRRTRRPTTPEKLADILTRLRGPTRCAGSSRRRRSSRSRRPMPAAPRREAVLEEDHGGPPMARPTAKLVAGLIGGKADGMAFLQELVP